MQVFTSDKRVPAAHRGAVIALGNFDGLHRGHQAVINAARDIAQRARKPAGLAMFDPHPTRFFRPEAPPFLLMSDQVRESLLPEMGISQLHKIPFTDSLREMDDKAFVKQVLHDALGVSHIVVGSDFGFGKNRTGNIDSLRRLAGELGIGVSAMEPVGLHHFYGKYGSTEIREALKNGNVMQAAHMLSRPWMMDGEIILGQQRGRTIGFPTANIEFGDYVRPKFGVYVTEMRLAGEDIWRASVANIGTRPTVGGEDARLEVHVFDFDKDIYGQRAFVRFRSFIRPEQKFDSFDALKAQIEKDALGARAVLGVRAG